MKALEEQLLRLPLTLPEAEVQLPTTSGIYAWWLRRGAIAQIPPRPNPHLDDYDLIYVGKAPRSAASARTLRSRCGDHFSGNTGRSTLCYILAALLMPQMRFTPLVKKTDRTTKCVLPPDQRAALRQWQQQNLRLTWAECIEPWSVEARLIQSLRPALNVKDNTTHSFCRTVKEARDSFRAAVSS